MVFFVAWFVRLVVTAYPNNELRLRVIPSGRASSWARADDWGADGSGDEASPPPPTLDITRDFESTHRPKAGYGALGRPTHFGRYAKNTLLRAGGALEKAGYQPSDTLFLTGTIPGSTDEAFRAMAEWSSWAVHRLKALVNHHCPSKLDFYVWEWQKRGALHLHYAVVSKDERAKSWILEHFKEWWKDILDEIGKRSGVDMWARAGGGSWADDKSVLQAYAQRVRKGVGQYLAKYCSKDSGKTPRDAYHPVRWWGISRALTRLIEEQTEELEIEQRNWQHSRESFTTLWETLKQLGLKGYRYAEDKGSGLFAVGYCASKVFQDIVEQVRLFMCGSASMRSRKYVWASSRIRTEFMELAKVPTRWALVGNYASLESIQTLAGWMIGGYTDEWKLWESVFDAMWRVWTHCANRKLYYPWARKFIAAALDFLEVLQEESVTVRAVLEQYPRLAITPDSKQQYLRLGAPQLED